MADNHGHALALINRLLFENSEPRSYATLFYAEYDYQSNRLRYANCGHLPGILFRGAQGAHIEKLHSANTVIGLFDAWECSISNTAMSEGDLLVLYTDGVTEAMDDDGEEFGEIRLIDVIRRNRSLPARALAEAIGNEVIGFGGGQQYDDITVVIAKKIR
ncbi:MAG: PP2C family protein-serine/threonine phosphatase [Terracidiphilus sp.]